MRWLRTYLATEEYDHANMTLDLLVDDEDRPVPRVPFCGWWGKLKSTAVDPIIVLSDGRVDFGSDEETDQAERYGHIQLAGTQIRPEMEIKFECDGCRYLFTIKTCHDLTQGLP